MFVLWIWIVLRYAVSVPAAVLEDESATDAIRRSIVLTKGSLLRVFALVAFTMVITYAVLAIFRGRLSSRRMAGSGFVDVLLDEPARNDYRLDRRRLHRAADDRGLCGSLLRSARQE